MPFVWNHEVLPICVGDCSGVKGEGRGGEGPYLSDEVRNLSYHHLSLFVFIIRYGYMESKEGTAALQTEEGLQRKIKKAVMDFQVRLVHVQIWHFSSCYDIDHLQAFAGLNQTGVVDGKTREMMDTPR